MAPIKPSYCSVLAILILENIELTIERIKHLFGKAKNFDYGLTVAILLIGALIAAVISTVEAAQTHAPSSKSNQPRLMGAPAFQSDLATLDNDLWNVSHGWSNGSYVINDWQKSQVRFDGEMTFTLEKGKSSEHPYSSAEVQSKATYGHGYFETTMKAAKGSGLITAFFTYTGPPFGKPWNEIDVEIMGSDTTEVLLTYFHHDKQLSHVHDLGFDASEGFHTYGFEWQPDRIDWYVDGEKVHSVDGRDVSIPNERQKLMFSLWGSRTLEEWAGPFDHSVVPVQAEYVCAGYVKEIADGRPCGSN